MDNNVLTVPGFDRDRNEYLKLDLTKLPEIPDGCIVHLKGFIDTQNSKFFETQISKILEARFKKLVFDCLELSYISSTGIGSISILIRQAKQIGGEIAFMNVQPKVLEVFSMLGFLKLFNLVSSTEEAVHYFKQTATEDKSVFPCVVECPMCQKNLKATHPGKFRCSSCKVILEVTDMGKVKVDLK